METKSLLIGITSFIAGGLLVSVAATTFEKDKVSTSNSTTQSHTENNLAGKTGDEFDKAFISEMIVHHQGAIEMAKLAENQARHTEIKQLSKDIITAQEQEIHQMQQWQANWGYTDSATTQPMAH